ncbi:MAG TPA: SusC/RagA family TonB-linked outer membrane protein, partial [Balneolaceae bacterium]|nr:SusC/RagA family TonB-linked outer membrane protein [Balneolaceae bacterium]
KPTTISGKRMVVVGYGKQQQENITASISSVNMNELNQSSYKTSVASALQDKIAGVTVQTSGAPGQAPAIHVRGIGTFGANRPLWVVDGIQVPDIIDFDPSLFQSVQALKDASASAIYGSRAANGVMLVQTKKGHPGPLQISYRGTFGTENVHQRLNMLGRKGYEKLMQQEITNAGLTLSGAQKAVDPNSKYFVKNINTNWQNRAWERGYSNKQVLNISGGDQHHTFDVGGSYQNNTGTFNGPAPAYKAVSGKVNTTFNKGIFKVGENIWLTRSINTPQTSIINNGVSLVGETLHSLPILPVHDPSHEGGYSGPKSGISQGLAMNTIGVDHLEHRKQYVTRALANIYGKINILKNLSYKINLAYDYRDFKENWFEPKFNLGYFFFDHVGHLRVTSNHNIQTTVDNTLHYHADVASNHIKVVAGFTQQRFRLNHVYSAGNGYSKPYHLVLNAANSTLASGEKLISRLRSYYGRLQYNYGNRYLATVSFRRDGSSRFAAGNRYGNFPAFSVGWRIGNEKFLKNVGWLNELKLRASWGKVGNQRIGDYATKALINNYADYSFNDKIAHGAIQESLVNKNLKWETLISRTIGLDTKLFRNKLNLSISYFNNLSKHVLVGVPLPGSLGSAANPSKNAASIKNFGLEVSAGYRSHIGALHFKVNTNITSIHNKVTSLGGKNALPLTIGDTRTAVGHPVGEFFGYVATGIFQNKQQIKNHATQRPGTAPGDIKFKDLNGDGKINAKDRTFIGSPWPDFSYGLGINLKLHRFTASFFFNGTYGNKIFSDQMRLVNNMADYNNHMAVDLKKHWTPQNHTNNIHYPRAVLHDPNANNRNSNRWVYDGTYLRLKNFTLGYNLPLKGTLGIQKLRLFLEANNLFTVTSYPGLDPSLGTSGRVSGGLTSKSGTNIFNNGLFYKGVDQSAWPHPRIFRVGINLKF